MAQQTGSRLSSKQPRIAAERIKAPAFLSNLGISSRWVIRVKLKIAQVCLPDAAGSSITQLWGFVYIYFAAGLDRNPKIL